MILYKSLDTACINVLTMPKRNFDPMSFGRRLTNEMRSAGLDVKALQARVRRKTNARGTSYGTVWSYVNGQAPTEPRREVINALAEIFSVRPQWLAFESGRRTTAEEAAAKAMADGRRPEPDYVQAAFRKVLPDLERLPYAESALLSAWELLRGRLIDYAPPAATYKGQKLMDTALATRLAEALMAPLDALQMNPGQALQKDYSALAFEKYLVLAAEAVQQLFLVETDTFQAPDLATWEAMRDGFLSKSEPPKKRGRRRQRRTETNDGEA